LRKPGHRRESYHGLILDEYIGPIGPKVKVDLAIYMASWEERAIHQARYGTANADRAMVLSFSDADNSFCPSEYLTSIVDGNLTKLELGSHYKIQDAVSAFIPKFFHAKSVNFGSIFIDVTCMPKYMAQYFVLEVLRTKVISELIIGYTAGTYHHQSNQAGVYDQGIDRYLSLPQTANVGISTRKGGIAALGADERLIGDYFTNEAGFDDHFLIAADGAQNKAVDEKVRNQTSALMRKFHLSETSVKSVAPPSFLGSLDAYEDFLFSSPEIDSWDIFCCGPKTHAIGACLAAHKHHEIKLIGRVPAHYDTTNVEAGDTISLLRILDATSPAVAKVRNIAPPFG